MVNGYNQKIDLKIILIIFFLSCTILIVTTPLHEAAHWIMSDIDPYVDPVEFHVFDGKSFNPNENILSSSLGYVVIKENYPGAFKDRPLWIDTFQEVICILIQILLTYIIISRILRLLINKKTIFIKSID
jgi:hypothetical protein